MPLIKPVLEAQIFAALEKQQTNTGSPQAAHLQLARDLATAIDAYVKSATIIVPPGQLITGAGGGPAPVVGATSAPSPPATIV